MGLKIDHFHLIRISQQVCTEKVLKQPGYCRIILYPKMHIYI